MDVLNLLSKVFLLFGVNFVRDFIQYNFGHSFLKLLNDNLPVGKLSFATDIRSVFNIIQINLPLTRTPA